MRVNPEEIRRVGQRVDREAGGWREQVAGVRAVNAGAFGHDGVGVRIGLFHARVHDVSIAYFTEVGECCSDMGIALIRTADLYAETERDNATKAALISAEIKNLGTI